MIQQNVLDKFKELFGADGDIRVYFAPGRVNLIGEHTDYNGGHVFPCALTIGTYMAARKRDDRKLRFYSMNFDNLVVVESSLDEFTPDPDGLWTNYPMGVMWAFEGRGMKLESGLDIVLFGNIPNGSGLSSSASLEVVTGYMLKDIYGFDGQIRILHLSVSIQRTTTTAVIAVSWISLHLQWAKRTMQFSLTAILLILSMHQSFWTVQRSWLQTAWLSTAL